MTRGEKVIAFISRHCKTPEGSHVGQPIILADFQKQFIKDIYDNPHGTRRAYLSIARKNGKSALIAGLLLAHLVGPEAVQNSQIVSGALSRDQAALVFSLAAKMITLNPVLIDRTRVIHSSKRIIGLSKNVEYKALAADGTTAHGLSPVLAILDEIGQIAAPTTPFIEAITTSQGAHAQPLLIAISTSAPSDTALFSTWVDDAEMSGDKQTVSHVYKAPEGADLLDEEAWKAANPALGLFRSLEDLRTQLEQAQRLPSLEASARNLLLNQRVAQESLYMAPSVLKACAGPIDLQVLRDNPAAVGLDLSKRNDLTAATVAARDPSTGIVHVLPFVFCPTSGIEERSRRDRTPYDVWVKDGSMIPIGGDVMDYDQIAEALRDRLDDLDIAVDFVEFDAWRMDVFKAAADRAGFASNAAWNGVRQGYVTMSPILESFESLALEKKIRYNNHPLINMAFSNAIATQDPAGNRKLDKSKSTARIDPAISTVMAVFKVSDGVGETWGDDLNWWIA